MKKTLLLDIDGVQRNIISQVINIYKRDFDNKSTITFNDIKYFDLERYFPNINGSIKDVFFREYAQEVFEKAKPYQKNISEVVKELQHKYIIHIVSHQFKGNEKYTLNWLEKYKITYDSITFTRDKDKVKGNILVDDAAHNLSQFFSKGREIACIQRNWNSEWRQKHFLQASYISLEEFLKKHKH